MNQGEENKSVNSEKKYENFLRDEIVVHTMPKSFRKIDFSGGKHMSTGIFVMVGGLVLLLGLGSLSYYLVVQKDFFSLSKKADLIIEEEKSIVIKSEKKETDSATTTNPLANATSTETLTNVATSTIDNLINDFNQDLGTSSLSTSSESLDISGNSSLSASSTQESSVLNASSSSNEQVQNESKKEGVIREATDADADGLSDLEEKILGTDPDKMDTDGDGFSDFQELDKMYDPAGKGNLASNKAITSYANPTHHYSLIYPAVWTPSNYDKDDSIMFKIDSSQFVQVIVQANPEKQTIEDFYKKITNVAVIDELQKVTKKTGWSGVVSKDGLFYYLKKDGIDDIYIVSYTLGINNTTNYQKLFEMMVNSLDIAN